jgi:type IV pilus assembly protein PilA
MTGWAREVDIASHIHCHSSEREHHMLASLKKRFSREDEGFTLIELMVVVLIIAILLAIAIPTFLGARERANDRAAQSSLRNALTAAKTIYTDNQDYVAADETSELKAVEPSLVYSLTSSSDFKQVAIGAAVITGSTGTVKTDWYAAAQSKSGKCFYIREVAVKNGTTEPGTYYGSDSSATCSASGAAAVTGAKF